MADDSYFSQIVNALRGGPSAPTVTTNLAPPLAQYPTQHDADYARNYGFGDNGVNEEYLNNQKARVLGLTNVDVPRVMNISTAKQAIKNNTVPKPTESFVPMSGEGMNIPTAIQNSQVVDLNKNPEVQGKLTNTMMRAALAANRSPIAAVGFDPSKVVIDSLIQHPTLGGAFSPKMDGIYTALQPDDSVVHESTHRGLQKLREQYPDQTNKLMGSMNSPDEETVVRWLMHSAGGDPEGNAGDMDAKQRQHAIDVYKMPYTGYKDSLNQLQELAIDAMKNRGKRAGPQ